MEITLFFGKTNPEFSNFHIEPFRVDGEVYNSVEHYFMFEKARLFDPDGEAIQKMGNHITPSQMKKLGRQVNNFDGKRWNGSESPAINYLTSNADIAMFKGNYAKYSQSKTLRDKLLATGDSILAEASPFDKLWGIGIGVSSPNAYKPETWKGSNKLGVILMLIRGMLRYNEYFSNKVVTQFKHNLYIPDWSHDWEFSNFNEFWVQITSVTQSDELKDAIDNWALELNASPTDLAVSLNLGFLMMYSTHHWYSSLPMFMQNLYRVNCQQYN